MVAAATGSGNRVIGKPRPEGGTTALVGKVDSHGSEALLLARTARDPMRLQHLLLCSTGSRAGGAIKGGDAAAAILGVWREAKAVGRVIRGASSSGVGGDWGWWWSVRAVRCVYAACVECGTGMHGPSVECRRARSRRRKSGLADNDQSGQSVDSGVTGVAKWGHAGMKSRAGGCRCDGWGVFCVGV
jgi:hypothetical protein